MPPLVNKEVEHGNEPWEMHLSRARAEGRAAFGLRQAQAESKRMEARRRPWDDAIAAASETGHLRVICKQVDFVDERIFRVPHVTVFALPGLQLAELPDLFRGDCGEDAHTLNLSHNLLQELPPSIGCLGNLRSLDCSHNQLRSLPDVFQALPLLETIHLHTNSLRMLPDSFGSLRKIRHLVLDDNQCVTRRFSPFVT